MERKPRPVQACGKKNTKVHMLDMDLREILREQAIRYLPAKALYRSQAVCRDWKLQISTPFFAHNQSVSCRSFSGIFVQAPGDPPFFVSLDQMAYGVPDQELKFLPEAVDINASSNGLLFCTGRGSEKAYYVCNPVNKHWKKLPKPSVDHGSNPGIALAFEPSVLSFGADFKVVCVFPSLDIEGSYEFDIYSSDRDSWTVASEMYFVDSYIRASKPSPLEFERSVYFDGVIYWPTRRGKTLCFDMKAQKASEMFTSGLGYQYNRSYTSLSHFGTMNGKLCTSSVSDLSVSVTVIDRHSNTKSAPSSTSIAERNLVSQLKIDNVENYRRERPQVIITWDGVVVIRAGKTIFSHDMKKHETKVLGHPQHTIGDSYVVVLPYVNSLVTLV